MVNINKRRGGYKSKSAGDYFENLLSFFSKSQRIKALKIPSGMRIVKMQGRLVQIPVQTPFDFVLFKNGRVCCIDCKTIESGNFNYSMIKRHQATELLEIEQQGVSAGYLIYYRDKNRVVFFRAKQLLDIVPGSSLKEENGILIGDNQSMNLASLF